MAQQSSGEFASANPTKARKMQGFKSTIRTKTLSTDAATYNTFNVQRHRT